MNSLISLKIKNDIGWPYNIAEYEYEDIDFIANKYIDIAFPKLIKQICI